MYSYLNARALPVPMNKNVLSKVLKVMNKIISTYGEKLPFSTETVVHQVKIGSCTANDIIFFIIGIA